MMRIGAFSRLGRISVKALHHYEAIGLLAPANVDAATGYRYYEPEQLQELRQLLALRALGLPLAHIRDAVHKPLSLKQLQQMLNERKYLLGRQIGAARVQLAAIEARLKQLNADTTCLPLNVVVHPVPAVVVASLRRVVPQHGAVTELFDEISSKLPPSARIIGYGAVWHSCSRETRKIDCEAIALLEQPTRKFDGLRIYELAGCDAACVVHINAENAFVPNYVAAREAVVQQCLELQGPVRERYFSTDGHRRFDITETQFPIRPT